MKLLSSNRARVFFLIACLIALRRAATAQESEEANASGFFLRPGAVARFNVKATLHATSPNLPPGRYNDGFVLPDNGGSAERTSNWGYNDANQIVGTDIVFHRYDTVPSVGNHDLNMDDPMFGGELVGGYRFAGYKFFGKPAFVGLQMAYGYSRSSQDLGFTASSTSSYTVDSYSLVGPNDVTVPPLAPYAGTDSGTGPLISLNPNSSTVSSTANKFFQGKFETTFQNVRIGPSVDLDLIGNLSVGMSFGYSSLYVDSKLNYTETTVFANPAAPTIVSSRTIGKAEWEPGFYLEINADYQFTRHFGAFLGGDFQYNKSIDFANDTHRVEIDLGSTYAAKAGLMVRF